MSGDEHHLNEGATQPLFHLHPFFSSQLCPLMVASCSVPSNHNASSVQSLDFANSSLYPLHGTMKIHFLILSMLCLAVIFFPHGEIVAQELPGTNRTFLLEHKFERGMEQVCDFTSSFKQTMAVSTGDDSNYEMKLDGKVRNVTAEVEGHGSIALVGGIGKSKLEITTGSNGTNDIRKNQTWISACRVESNGKSVRRDFHVTTTKDSYLRDAIDQISECSQLCAAFPTGRVTVGSQWTGDVLLPVPGTRQTGTAVSTITDLKRTNGVTYCIIRSVVSSSKAQSFDGWTLPISKNGMEIKGVTEGCFDIKHGIWLQTRLDLDAKIEGQSGEQGYECLIKIKGTTKIVSCKLLPGDEAADWNRKIKALDGALEQLYRNEYEIPVKSLEMQKQRETNADWKEGIETLLSAIQPLLSGTGTIAK